jgi:hypothetical protein
VVGTEDPDNILVRFAALNASVRQAHAQIRGGTIGDATLRRVHDAAVGVIGAARHPADVEDKADADFDHLAKLNEHIFEAMDRLAEKLTIPSETMGAEGRDMNAPYKAPVWAPCAPNSEIQPECRRSGRHPRSDD